MAIKKEDIDAAIEISKLYGATKLVLFGSCVDTPETANDLDLAVDGIPGFKIFAFGEQLERKINFPVDIVPLDMKSGFIDYILKYGKTIYES